MSVSNTMIEPQHLALWKYLRQKHEASLLIYANKLCFKYGHDPDRAREYLQDFHIKVLTCPPGTFANLQQNRDNFKYLCSVLKNCTYDKVRKVSNLMNDSTRELIPERITDTVEIDEYCATDVTERFFNRIRKLIANQENAEILILALKGYKHKEIAELLNMNTKTVSVKVSRTKKRLRELLEPIYPEYCV